MLQKLLFTKNIDGDTSPELMPEGVGRTRLNVRVLNSLGGESQSAETVNGNTLVSFTLPAGNNIVIGAKEYLLKKKIYYFVYNSNNSHLILEYDQVTNSVAAVFRDSVGNILGGQTNILNFNPDYLITGIDVVKLDENNDLLYWTDWLNEPRKINIRKGKLFASNLGGYKSPFDPQILYRIKQPPLYPPTYKWRSSLNNTTPTSNVAAHGTSAVTAGAVGVYGINYNSETSDTLSEYNPITGVFIPSYSGIFNINATAAITNTYNSTTVPLTAAKLVVYVNGVATIYADFRFTWTVVGNVYSIGIGGATLSQNVHFNAGDLVTFKIVITGYNGGALTLLAQNMSIVGQGAPVALTANYLWKKLFQFKVQFVYDDFERSACSPISRIEYPNTQIPSGAAEDYYTQDDLIDILIPTGNSIVEKIRILAKQVGTADYVLIAELNKSQLSIPDYSHYTYTFDNKGNYAPIEVNESIKLFDSVPLASQSQALLVNNRLADGLIKEGYDNVNVNMQLTLSYMSVNNLYPYGSNNKFPTETVLKTGGKYKWFIVYYDHSNRSGTANYNGYSYKDIINGYYGNELTIPFLTDSSYANYPNFRSQSGYYPSMYVPVVSFDIYNPPPTWATHYQLLRTNNLGSGRYFQFAADQIEWINMASGSVVAFGAANQDGARISINNLITSYNKTQANSKLVYDYAQGDRLRCISTRNDVPESYNDSEILSFDAGTQKVVVRMTSQFPARGDGFLFEIYNPTTIATDIVYEIGECYPIGSVYINGVKKLKHLGQSVDQDISFANFDITGFTDTTVRFINIVRESPNVVYHVGDKVDYYDNTGWHCVFTISSISGSTINGTIISRTPHGMRLSASGYLYRAATIVSSNGDTARTFHRIPYQTYSSTAYVNFWLEQSVASVFYDSLVDANVNDIGRPNEYNPGNKQIVRPSTIYYSEELIPETFINGLSSVYDINFETYNQSYGGIYKLYADQQGVFVFQELKIGFLKVEQIIYNDLQGGTTVGASPQVLSPQMIYYTADYGIGVYPESFAVYGNSKYGVDVRRGVIWRLDLNGLTPISKNANMDSFITAKFKGILASSTKVNLFGVFDVRFNEYILAAPDFTLAYNEKFNGFSTFYSYNPEMMVGNAVDIITFKNGGLYLHNTNSVQNNFYGLQYDSNLQFYCNLNPSNIKVFEAISLESMDKWDAEITTPITSENPNGQYTALVGNNFQMKEGYFYSQILKDDFTPNIVNNPSQPYFPNARFEGRDIRGQYALISLTYNGVAYSKIFACNINVIPSNRSNM